MAEAGDRSGHQQGTLPLLLTASVGCAMTVLDTNIVAIILPTIARDFQANFAQVEWVISAYVLCFASLLLPAGALADRFGRKRLFLIGTTGFAVASLLCALAPSADMLYVARGLQGVGAAFLLAPALSVIAHAFHGEQERNRAWATWGTIMGVTMVCSPILGGLVAHWLGWRWAFFVNVPICVALALATMVFVWDSRDEAAQRIDPAGIILFSASMFGLTWGLISAQAHGWGAERTLFGFFAALVAFVGFVLAEMRQSRPMLDLSLFRNGRLIGAVWAMFAYAACAQVMASLLPQFLQNGIGFGALTAGMSMLPFATAMLVFPHVGRWAGAWLDSAAILGVGLLVTAAGNGLIAVGAAGQKIEVILVGMVVLGAGGGLLNGETQKAVMTVVPRERAGMASGISTTARFSGILIGFTLLSAVLANGARSALAGLGYGHAFADAVVAGDLPQALKHLKDGGAAASMLEAAPAQAHHAYAVGFSIALAVAAGVALISAVLVWRLVRDRSHR